MSIKVGNLEFFAGPHTVGRPDDLEAAIVGFINGAEKRLDIAVQELESVAITDAIIAARLERGVRVSVVLEADYLSVTRPVRQPREQRGTNELNRQNHDALLRAKIWVRTDFNPHIFHQKFIVRDKSAVLTGSTNFTPTGTHKNLNHVLVVKDAAIAKIYAREFAEIKQGRFGKRNEGHDPKPPVVMVSQVPLKVCFAPDHAPEMEIVKQMLKAQERIDFAIFTFSQSSAIDDAMLKLNETGLTIRGVMDGMQARKQSWAAARTLEQSGIGIRYVDKGAGINKLHHKLMVIDKSITIIGSFNYTGPANAVNDENIIVIGSHKASAASQKAQKKIAQFAFDEIDAIWDDFGTS